MEAKNLFALFIVTCVCLAACKPSVKPESLYGKWDYIKVANPNSNPPDSVTTTDLLINKPYIQFSKNDSLLIFWGGRVLSQGTFRIDGSNIQYKEILPGGKTREFPFWVSKLDEHNLVFETKGEDGSRVTAVRK